MLTTQFYQVTQNGAIALVYDFGQTDGLFYIVMEYVDGVNLRQAIQSGGLSPANALAIVPQICEALQFAHDEGIVHRDIKPENILIDTKGRVKIADFGLAKLLGHDAADRSLTGTHQVMGTVRYMAPEQMEGARSVDHRADIYSLGVVFYEMLTGELPLGRFAPPSERVRIDVRLDEVVMRSLENEPARRYQHASEVKSDVEMISRTVTPINTRQDKGDNGASGNHDGAPPTTVASTLLKLLFVGIVTVALMHIAQIVFWTKVHTGYVYEDGVLNNVIAPDPASRPDTMFLFVDGLVALAVCFFVSRAVWPGVILESPTKDQVGQPSPSPDWMRNRVQAPALGLLLTGALGCALSMAMAAFVLWRSIVGPFVGVEPPRLIVLAMALFAVYALVIFAAIRMRQFEDYQLVCLFTLLAILIPPVNVVGLPIGIWALLVLLRPEVKAAFDSRKRR